MTDFALGDAAANIHVYVEKAPPVEELWGETPSQGTFRALNQGEIKAIGDIGGNGWGKVFNVYAKWLMAFDASSPYRPENAANWQAFRDSALLQSGSHTALHVGHWSVEQLAASGGIHVIAGRTHANKLGLSEQCIWLDNEFARHPTMPVVICPYFDHRQLSNIKINVLTKLVDAL